MKNYQKPTLDIMSLTSSNPISNLADWLTNVNSDYEDAAIVTYEVVS